MENQGSAVAVDAGPAGARLPEVEVQDTGVTQGGGGANRGGYAGLSDGWGGGGDEVNEKALPSFIL